MPSARVPSGPGKGGGGAPVSLEGLSQFASAVSGEAPRLHAAGRADLPETPGQRRVSYFLHFADD